ncbi:CDP-alcohol phosphatidyltransferase family protein [Paenibacillus turpanensis]|uniref:CDP-alcohol phosphatidyltransferase family protein n=1 Tax=Paenibacillus turpanensis TaxID=2689078 RepID=UPI0031330A65
MPNLLTFGRFALVPVYLAVFHSAHPLWALGVLLLAGLTDIADGWIARSRGITTALGAMLDPLADKCMMLAVMLSLLLSGQIPWSAAIVLALREVCMIAGSAYFTVKGWRTVPANQMGKLTTVLLYISIVLIFIQAPFRNEFLWGTIFFSLFTSWNYIVQFRHLNDLHGMEKEHIGK